MFKGAKIFLVLLIGLILPIFFAYATTGTIDSTNKYAWSNNIGWINFGCTNCNVQVTDSAITGYAWNENYGWIKLNPSTSGVTNTVSGDVGGYAWGENTGWIDFSNVSINTSTGNFSGTATGDVVGTISFGCTATGCPVKTTWRPTNCGNGTIDPGEACDDGANNGSCPKTCSALCASNSCGGGGDTTPPVTSNYNPANNSTISDSTPTITFNTDERGDCYISQTDYSYNDMVANSQVDCVEDGAGTSHTCQMTDLGAEGLKHIYISCQDYPIGNKDTVATNTELTYTLDILDTEPPVLSFTDDVAVGPVVSDTIIADWGDALVKKWDYDADGICSNAAGDYSKTNSDSMSQSDATNNGKYICLYGEDSTGNKSNKISANDINISIPDTTLPVQSNWNPADGSTITTATPTITLTLNEAGDCYAATTDWGYDDMKTNGAVDCTENGLTMTCTGLNLGSNGTKNVYISCQDYPAGNKNTASNNKNLSYTLNISAPTITIDNPNSAPAQTKTIAATTSKGTLYMSNTAGSVCNETLAFIVYASQTFSLESDNGKKVCYKAVDSENNIAYSMSGIIAGIDTTLPIQSNWNPADGSTITTATPTITLTLNEAGDCYAATTDWGYDDMKTNGAVDCTENGLTMTCTGLNLGSNGTKNVYISCQDYPAGNKNTASNNKNLSYTLNIPSYNTCDEYQRCVRVLGVEEDQCSQNSDCISTYSACVGETCVQFNGIGANSCSTNTDCQSQGGGGTSVEIHNICQNEKCIAVAGPGQDQCSQDSNCTEIISKTIISIAKTVDENTKEVIQSLPAPVRVVAEGARKILQSDEGEAIVGAVTTTGVAVAATAATAVTIGSIFTVPLFDLFLIPIKALGLVMSALGIRKRTVPWGVVYDSVTKRPLDPAYVILKNPDGSVIATAITDIDGRYGFLVGPGKYIIEAKKTNYTFPSIKLQGRNEDELHNNLYFGQTIIVDKPNQVFIQNIPLDPVKFDWNEFAKQDKSLSKFYSKWDVALRRFYDISFLVGFIVAIIAFFFAPYPYNTITIGLYLLLVILRFLGVRPKTYGYIKDKLTGNPLSFAIIRVFIPGINKEIAAKAADKYGKYYCLVPPGKYYIRVEKKNIDGSYTVVYTSETIDVSRKGIIRQVFSI
jgi:hypothetical protein